MYGYGIPVVLIVIRESSVSDHISRVTVHFQANRFPDRAGRPRARISGSNSAQNDQNRMISDHCTCFYPCAFIHPSWNSVN